jgi:Domain of unknown function (DUF1737)
MSATGIVEYKAVGGITLEHLVKEVNKHIADGWQPLGGIAVSPQIPEGSGALFVQAVIKPIVKEGLGTVVSQEVSQVSTSEEAARPLQPFH